MSNSISEQLRIYCGMHLDKAHAFLDLYDGKVIASHQFIAFGAAGLIVPKNDPKNKMAHTLTNTGDLMRARIVAIQNSTYHEAPSKFTPEELTALAGNVTRLARKKMPKSLGIKSIHLKLLVKTARHPGIVLCSLVDVFGADAVGLLISKRIVGREDEHVGLTTKHVPLYPLTQGLSLLNWCLNEIGLNGEQKWEKS